MTLQNIFKELGDRAAAVAKLASPTGLRWPAMGVQLDSAYPHIEAEVRYAVRYEYAVRATDVIARRLRVAFLNASAAHRMLPRVIEIMGQELGWSTKRKQEEMEIATKFLKTMGLSNSAQSKFNGQQLISMRTDFDSMDEEKDGTVELHIIKDYLNKRFEGVEDLDSFISAADENKSETIEFDEFIGLVFALQEHKKAASKSDKKIEPLGDDLMNYSTTKSGGGV